MENNKIIAEFMGVKFDKDTFYDMDYDIFSNGNLYRIHELKLKYHNSWDWLMPVVEKIEYIESITHGNQFQVIICEEEVDIYDKHTQTHIVCIPTDGESKLTNTYKAVVEFIKNQNN